MAESQSQAQSKQKDLALLSPPFLPFSRGLRTEIASVGNTDDLDTNHQSSMESSVSNFKSPQALLASTSGPSITGQGNNSLAHLFHQS